MVAWVRAIARLRDPSRSPAQHAATLRHSVPPRLRARLASPLTQRKLPLDRRRLSANSGLMHRTKNEAAGPPRVRKVGLERNLFGSGPGLPGRSSQAAGCLFGGASDERQPGAEFDKKTAAERTRHLQKGEDAARSGEKASPPIGHECSWAGSGSGTGGYRGVGGTDLRAHHTVHCCQRRLNQWIFG